MHDEAAPVKFLYDPDGQGWQGPPSGPKKPATQVQLAGSMLLAGARHATQRQWPVLPTYCRRHLGIQSGRQGEEEKEDRKASGMDGAQQFPEQYRRNKVKCQ